MTLCHLTENLFDKFRNGEMAVTEAAMDIVMAATGAVRDMFSYLERGSQPPAADAELLAGLKAAIAGEVKTTKVPTTAAIATPAPAAAGGAAGPDWDKLFQVVAGAPAATAAATTKAEVAIHHDVSSETPEQIIQKAIGRRASDKPGYQGPVGRRTEEKTRDNSIRVDTSRLDQVLNLSGEIGLTKNRLTHLRSETKSLTASCIALLRLS